MDQVLSEEFLLGAYRRLQCAMTVLFFIGVFPIFNIYGKSACVGFAIGSVVSALNFMWLKQSVHSLAERIARTGSRSGGSAIVLRSFGRYGLIGLAGYVITFGSPHRLYGFLVGLQLWVFALLIETIYEVLQGTMSFSEKV